MRISSRATAIGRMMVVKTINATKKIRRISPRIVRIRRVGINVLAAEEVDGTLG